MRIVPQALIRPAHCAMLPHLGSAHPEGYVDCGSELPGFDNHGYASVVFVKEAARLLLGWSPPEDVQALNARIADLERENEQLRDDNAVLEREFDAIDMLVSAGFQARKKPGPQPKVKEAA